MDKSLKLKLPGPKPLLTAAKDAYGGGSLRKPQCPMNGGCCMAASGEEASIILTTKY